MRIAVRVTLLLLAGLALAGVPVPASAQGPVAAQVPVTVRTSAGDVTILADQLEEIGPDDLLIATGNVEITRGTARLMADRVEINRQTGDAVAQGRAVFYDGEDQLTGSRIEYNLKTGTGRVYETTARVAPYYRFSGEQVDRLGPSVYRVRRGVFTTCEGDPPAWSFRFGEATADLNEYVYGRNASFWVKDVPLIPLVPFFAAAIRRERQTGVLFPRLGHSSSKGFYYEQPFYWAISDSQDATLAPLVYERRGVGLTGEYRYLFSSQNRGEIRGFGLREFQRGDDNRGILTARHDWIIGPGLTLKAFVNAVTDDRVLRDYGDPLDQRATQRAESNVFLTKTWESWNLVGDLFWYQDLTERRPVELQRLPEIGLTGVRQPVPGLSGLYYEVDASYVNFVRDVGSDGMRADLHPRLSRPIGLGGALTVTPFVGGRLTAYDRTVVGLRRTTDVSNPIEVTEDTARLRRLVEAGSDLELGLARVYTLAGRWGLDALLHSIEPRVNYTWITGTHEDRLPNWTEAVDRIGETNRVAYSLTNRIRAKTITLPDSLPVRWELLRLVLGHSWDLRRERPESVTGIVILQPTQRLRVRGDVAHGVHGEGVESASGDISAVTPLATVGLGARYSDLAQTSFVTANLSAPLTPWAALRASTAWDQRQDRFVDSRLAVDFKFQCWAITVEYVHREGRDDDIRFAVSLLGVGGPVATSVGLGSLSSSGLK